MAAATRGTVLITGGARRIGAAIATSLAAGGWKTIVHYNRSGAEAESLAARIERAGGQCCVIGADLGQRADIEGLLPACIRAFGAIDCLINNASHFSNDSIANVTWESLQDHLLPNLAAPILLARDFARHFAGPTGGCVINLLDQKVANLNPDFLSYTVSKVALAGVTQMLAMAFAPAIRVCGIAPGLTLISGKQTEESFRRAWHATPLGRSSTPEEIAACVQFILATPSMTGHTVVLDGGESIAGRRRDVAFDLPPTAS